MSSDKFSLSLPAGYLKSLDKHAAAVKRNRSEFIKLLFDGFLSVTRKRQVAPSHEPHTFFPWLEGEERRKADEEFGAYLDLIVRIYESEQARLTPEDQAAESTASADASRN